MTIAMSSKKPALSEAEGNSTLVRAYLGYDRLDSVVQTLAANHLFELMWIYYNLFQPVMHLVEKQVVREDGKQTRIQRRHDQARTPFDRLCATDAILPEHQAQLEALRDRINPRELRRQIYNAIDHLFTLPGAAPGAAENVHLTLVENANGNTLDLAFNRTPIRQ